MNTQTGNTKLVSIVVILAVILGGFYFFEEFNEDDDKHDDDAMMMKDGKKKDGDAMMMDDDSHGDDAMMKDGEKKDGDAMMMKDGHGHMFTVTITNVSDSQPLSPGVFVTHTSEASLNFAGSVSPESLEPLAEYGDHAAFADFVATVPGVSNVYRIDAPVLPGESTEITVEAADGEMLSGILMAVASNDGYALLDAVALDETVPSNTVVAANYDNGTEENTELGSGFEGGQPDPDRGEENVENGTPTDPQAPVSAHEQLTEGIMEVTIAFQS